MKLTIAKRTALGVGIIISSVTVVMLINLFLTYQSYLEIQNINSSELVNTLNRINISMYFQAITVIFGTISGIVIGYVLTHSTTKILREVVNSLTISAQNIDENSDQLDETSKIISDRAHEQTTSLQESSASLEEISGMAKMNSENSEKSKNTASKVQDLAEHGSKTVINLQNSVSEIEKANDKIQHFVTLIESIAEKTEFIDQIVFQTKLLSFNASVEAERAGEHGRGFSVVAQEIGNLAQMSGSAAIQISKIVKDSIAKSEEVARENQEKVVNIQEIVKDTITLLKDIESHSREATHFASEISNSSAEQVNGIQQVNQAINQLDEISQKNSATSTEAASMVEKLNQDASKLKEVIREIEELTGIKS